MPRLRFVKISAKEQERLYHEEMAREAEERQKAQDARDEIASEWADVATKEGVPHTYKQGA